MSSKFFIGVGEADLMIDDSRSLKDKRRVLAGLKERLAARFRLAICEFGDQNLWQRAQLGLVLCSNDRVYVQGVFNDLREFLGRYRSITLLNLETRLL